MKDLFTKYEIDWNLVILISTILLSAFILTKLLRWIIDKSLISPSEKLNADPTRYKFLKNAVSLIVLLIAIGALVSLIPELKALAVTIFAGAGILVLFLGLASQQAFSNIVGGIFIVIFKPFRVGDLIKVGNLDYGIVEDITLRHTVIIDFENKHIIIPNSVISAENIINDSISDEKICRRITIGISYDSDIELATRIIQEEAVKHPKCIDNRTQEEIEEKIPQVVVRVISFGDFSVNLRADVWTDDPFAARPMHYDINKAVKRRFDLEGIEIPFPYRTIVYKKDLPSNT